MSQIRIFVLFSLTALLTACGGGGGGSEDAVDKYVGVWVGCFPSGQALDPFTKSTFVVSKTGANSGSTDITAENLYADAACSVQTQTFKNTIPSIFVIDGPGTVQGKPVDKITGTFAGVVAKDILFRTGNQLFAGSGPLDAEGYPTNFTSVLNKQ